MTNVAGRSARLIEKRRAKPELFVPGDELQVRELASLWFGREMNTEDFLGMAGKLPDSNVLIGLCEGTITIETWGEKRWPIWAFFRIKKQGGRILLSHDYLRAYIPRERRAELVELVFLAQRRIALRLGIDSLRHCAEPLHAFSTYEHWPAWGFDAALPDLIRNELPLGLERVQRVSELVRTKRGRLWSRQCQMLESLDLSCDFNVQGTVPCEEPGQAFGEKMTTPSEPLPVAE